MFVLWPFGSVENLVGPLPIAKSMTVTSASSSLCCIYVYILDSNVQHTSYYIPHILNRQPCTHKYSLLDNVLIKKKCPCNYEKQTEVYRLLSSDEKFPPEKKKIQGFTNRNLYCL